MKRLYDIPTTTLLAEEGGKNIILGLRHIADYVLLKFNSGIKPTHSECRIVYFFRESL